MSVRDLKAELLHYKQRCAELEGMLDAFWTGSVQENSSLEHFILAQYGRVRLEKKRSTAALLGGEGR